jgi:hypothetical protein
MLFMPNIASFDMAADSLSPDAEMLGNEKLLPNLQTALVG